MQQKASYCLSVLAFFSIWVSKVGIMIFWWKLTLNNDFEATNTTSRSENSKSVNTVSDKHQRNVSTSPTDLHILYRYAQDATEQPLDKRLASLPRLQWCRHQCFLLSREGHQRLDQSLDGGNYWPLSPLHQRKSTVCSRSLSSLGACWARRDEGADSPS